MMDFAYLIRATLTVLLLHSSFGQDADKPAATFQIKISPDAQNLLFQIGTNRILRCLSDQTDEEVKPVLRWEINDVPITATANSERIRVESITDNDLSLRVENLRREDAGNYKCVGTLGSETDSRSIKIEIYEAIAIVAPADQTGILDQNGEVSCDATGDPTPLFSWKFDNFTKIVNSDKYTVDRSKLTIKNLSFSDTGIYRCELNVFTTGQSNSFTINYQVVKPPHIESAPTITPASPIVGNEVTLTCQADGVPEPTYQFRRSDDYPISGKVDEKQGTLTISKLTQDDEADYICVATNKGGEAEKGIFLDVKVSPTIKEDKMPEEMDAVEGETTRVSCVAEGDPLPNISWQKVGMPMYDEDSVQDGGPAIIIDSDDDQSESSIKIAGKSMEFASIKVQDAGTYICRASSQAGTTSRAIRINVQYKPNFNTDYKETNFYGWEGHTSNLTCMANANEIATIDWYRIIDDGTEVVIESRSPYVLFPAQEWPSYHLSSRSLLVTIGSENSDVYGSYACDAKNSIGSTKQNVRLIQAVPPQQPIVRVSSTLSTMVVLDIDAPEEDGGQPVLNYRYIYHPADNDSDSQESSVVKTKNTTSVELRNLRAKTSYTVRVSAQNAVGDGEETPLSFETKEVSKPIRLNMTSPREGPEATTYRIVWSEPDDGGSEITKFIIKYKKVVVKDDDASLWEVDEEVSEDEEVEETVDNPTALSHTLHNLDPNSFYSVNIIAVNKEGHSAPEWKIVRTSEKTAAQANLAAGGGKKEEEKEKEELDDYADDNDEGISSVSVEDGKNNEVKDGEAGGAVGRGSDSQLTGALGSGAIAGIVIALFIIFIIVAVILLLIFKKKPELVGRLRGLGGKGGEEERGNKEDGKDPAEEEKLIKKDDIVKVETETEEGKPEQMIDEAHEEFEPDSKPETQTKPETGAANGTGDKPQDLGTPAATTEIKITPETPEKPETPTA